MPKLPNGLVVAISSERARYHATRRGLRITPETPHDQLFPLVDILYADDGGGEAGGPSRYRFTGYTLADGHWLGRWKPRDRDAFVSWLGEPQQYREIEEARRKVVYDTLPHRVLRYPLPERLYSVLRRRILNMAMESASAEQWRKTILNMTRCGVRMEEIVWSGVLDFLEGEGAVRGTPILREEILSRIEFGEIRLELTNELVRDERCPLPFEETASILDPRVIRRAGVDVPSGGHGVLRFVDGLLGYRVGYLRTPGADPSWFVLDAYGGVLNGGETFADAAAAREAAAEHARRGYGLKSALHPSDKYEYMTLHGGEEYREWLVTLPDYPRSHFTSHFTERNVLLHFRTKLRRDLGGHRLLYIEEIQSDWHQQAHRRGGGVPGGGGTIPEAPFRKEWSLLALKLILLHAVEQGYDGLAWTPGPVQQMRFQCDKGALARLYDKEIANHLSHLSSDWGGRVERTWIETREPWISAVRVGDYWGVSDKSDKRLSTRMRFTKAEAVELCERHSKRIVLEVPLFRIPRGMREKIAADGLPRFGETVVDRVRRPLCGDPGFKGCDAATELRCRG